MANSTAKRHHTVPQFYLRGFSERNQIATVKLPGEHRFVQPVRKAASETHFYRVEGHEDGPDAFEKLLGDIEGKVAVIFASIINGTWPLPPEDRITIAYFIALQASRGPEQRRNMEYLSAQTTRMEIGYGGKSGVKAWVKRNHDLDISTFQAEQLWEHATQPGGPPIRLNPIAHIKSMVNQSQTLTPYISGRPWTLVRFKTRSLITSDTPVSLVPQPEAEPWEGVGFMTAWGVTYPLTRKLGLLMNDPMPLARQNVPVQTVRDGRFDFVQTGSTAMEKFMNANTIDSASMWLYHHPDDERFVPDRLPEPSPVTMGFVGGPEEFSGEPAFRQKEPKSE